MTELDIRMVTPPTRRSSPSRRATTPRCSGPASRCRAARGDAVGITDKYSWIPDVFAGQGAALVWDDSYAPSRLRRDRRRARG
ncbi:hypothetical protein NKG05_09065 [Oerskovia sp. M15]